DGPHSERETLWVEPYDKVREQQLSEARRRHALDCGRVGRLLHSPSTVGSRTHAPKGDGIRYLLNLAQSCPSFLSQQHLDIGLYCGVFRAPSSAFSREGMV